eukprot:CAMPEP_0184699248 /NCGR_PEP_ID=MMETSP0313-20130426/5589_1 /TAXON_ID=2792 /ORGANISM="Porphyridium aerugineum, Strain SAG 1380-2" /LENGTH=99 /DNA_ID=CAMNT_0027158313 /DNA_START=298 /DNA_END=594 /DNA_ORIENTATION=+
MIRSPASINLYTLGCMYHVPMDQYQYVEHGEDVGYLSRVSGTTRWTSIESERDSNDQLGNLYVDDPFPPTMYSRCGIDTTEESIPSTRSSYGVVRSTKR